jgi:uncharacterized protein YybS (DUF2232 family)
MKKNVRMLTEGSMMLAIIGVFLLFNLQSAGLLEAYLIWAVPLPIIFYLCKYGLKQGLILALATFFLTLLTGNFITLFYMGGAMVIGLVYGYGVRSQRSNAWLIIATTLLTALSLFVEMFLLAAIFGYNLLAETQTIVDTISQMQGVVFPDDMTTLVLSVYPVALLLMAFLQALITHFLAIILLKRLHITTRKMRPLQSLKLPKWLGFLALAGLFAGSIFGRTSDTDLRIIMTLVLTVSGLILMADAYILIMITAQRRRIKYLPFIAVLALLFLPSIMIYAFIGLGLMDCFTDIRERIEIRER